jgi:hypothetical protein
MSGVKMHWRSTIAEMKRASAKALETWIDYGKNCNAKATNMAQQLLVELDVAGMFVEAMDGTDKTNAHASRAIVRLDEVAKKAATLCWKCRKGGKYTQEELDVDRTEFESHRARLLFKKDEK